MRKRALLIRTANGEMDRLTAALRGMLGIELRRTDIYASCVSCINFDHEKELCNKATPPQRPPAHIIADACPAYEDDNEIPF
jgi:hypothetical protein